MVRAARTKSRRTGAEGQGYQGVSICSTGLLQLLHHVSEPLSRLALRVADKVRLLFMTYNGWIMLAVAGGAFIGFMVFGGGSSAKTVACH